MEIPVSLPIDHDGFLRRECPSCFGEFKWHHGPANAEAEQLPSPVEYHCPRCGQSAPHNAWFTQAQAKYMREAAAPALTQMIDDELGKAFKGLNSKHIKVTKTARLSSPASPMPLTEPDDMEIVTSPCHAWEPVKVPHDAASPLYCLICGAAFVV